MLLSDGDVTAMRSEYRVTQGKSNVGQLSERYGVAVNTVKGIVKRTDRAWVAA